MRKSEFVKQLSLGKWFLVSALVAVALGALLPGRFARAETLAQKNANVGAFDILGIKLGMSRSEVENLLKAKIKAGKKLNRVYKLEKKHEPSYELFQFRAARPDNKEATHLTVYFLSNQSDESHAFLIHRRDDIESLATETIYESLVKKYGVPTFESKGRQEFIWSEHTGKRCREGKHLLRSMKNEVATECGMRLVVSLVQKDAITGFEMVLKEGRKSDPQ